jgi:V/A-type H+-transporting ATPase subunit C
MSSSTATRRQAPGGKDYGYSNARLRGMRSRLFDASFFNELIEAPDIQHLAKELADTEYGADLEEALIHGRDAAAVDEALKHNMVRTFQKVHGFLNDEAHYILTTLLGRWDIFNIKTVIRGKHMHLSAEEIADGLLPAGYLNEIDLEALSRLDDVRAVVDTSMTWSLPFAGALSSGYPAYAESGDLSALELSLDRYYATWALERFKRRGANMKLARDFLGIHIDIANLVMVFRLQKADMEKVDVDSLFLEGGADIGLDLYRELARMSDVDEVLDRLRGTSYGLALDDAAVAYLENNSISVFERALEDFLMRRANRLGVRDALGVGVAITYLWAKQNEITNLRIIVKGIAVGMPEDRVRGELILV